MNFNPEYIKQLAEGSIILQHTKLPKDLPLLVEIIKHIFPKDSEPTGDTNFYFRLSKGQWGGLTDVPIEHINKPIIPLHDFVSPTKEEKQTIDTIDARLKELEGLVKDNGNQEFIQWLTRTDVANKIVKMVEGKMKTAPQEEQPKAEWKVGEWIWTSEGELTFITSILGNVMSVDNQGGNIDCLDKKNNSHTKPTKQEVGDYLIGLAKAKGFKAGIEIDQSKWGGFKVKLGEVDFNYNNGNLHLGGWVIWYKGTWAEVLLQAKEDWNVLILPFNEFRDDYKIVVYPNNGWLETKEQAEKYAETIKNALNHG